MEKQAVWNSTENCESEKSPEIVGSGNRIYFESYKITEPQNTGELKDTLTGAILLHLHTIV